MPMIRHALILLAGGGALAGAVPALAQNAYVSGYASVLDGPALVPYNPGAAYPHTLGPPRRGAAGRPRWFGRLDIEMDVQPACSLRLTPDAGVAIHCSSEIPFLAVISSDADPDFEQTLAFMPRIETRSSFAAMVPIHAQRLTVDY